MTDTTPHYIQDDVKLLRRFLHGRGDELQDAFDRVVATLEQWGGGKVHDKTEMTK